MYNRGGHLGGCTAEMIPRIPVRVQLHALNYVLSVNICDQSAHGLKLVEYPPPETLLQQVSDLWRRCVGQPPNHAAWRDYLVAIRPLVLGVARRVALFWNVRDPADIEDIFQEICIKLSRQSSSLPPSVFDSDSSAEAYLRVVAENTARDVMRSRFALKRNFSATKTLDNDRDDSPQDDAARSIDLRVLFREIEELLEGSARDRAVFWLYYRQGFTAGEIALIPAIGLSSKGVESLLLRMTASIRARILKKHRSASAGRLRREKPNAGR